MIVGRKGESKALVQGKRGKHTVNAVWTRGGKGRGEQKIRKVKRKERRR